MLHYTSHEVRRALDTIIATEVSTELTGMRGMVLGYIVDHVSAGADVYQRDLETNFHIRRSSVTTLLQGMEQCGFITRKAVEQDARLKSLVPTEKGLACRQQIEACVNRFDAQLKNGISDAELQRLYAVLDTVLGNVRAVVEQQQT